MTGESVSNLIGVPVTVGGLRQAFDHKDGEVWKTFFVCVRLKK